MVIPMSLKKAVKLIVASLSKWKQNLKIVNILQIQATITVHQKLVVGLLSLLTISMVLTLQLHWFG